MNTPTKNRAGESSSKNSPNKGKRKLQVEEAVTPARAIKQRSIPSAQLKYTDTDTDDSKRRKLKNKAIGNVSNPSFAAMYSFTSHRSQGSAVVDLTNGDSPDTVAQKRKASFSNARLHAFNPTQGPKKLVVKNLRTTPRVDPAQYFEKVWKQDDEALTAIFSNHKEPYSLEELYKGSENVCRQGRAAELYTRLCKRCQGHLSGSVRDAMLQKASESNDIETLKAVVNAWMMWQRQLGTIRHIFFYLNQTYLLRSFELPSVAETGTILFRNHVFQETIVRSKVVNGVATLINKERQKQATESDSALLKDSISVLHDLSVYTSDFEPFFKTSTEAYFRSWRDTEAEKSDLRHYATACSQLYEQEMTRCDLLNLDRTTRELISELFDTIFVEEKVDVLTNEDSVLDLLEQNLVMELSQTYTLLQRKGQGNKLVPPFSKYIDDEGTSIVFDEKEETDMVIRLLDLKKRLDHFMKMSLQDNEPLGNAYHKSFEHFINKTKKSQANWDTDNAKVGEMIAKHVDLLLKGGVKAIPKLATQKDSSKADEEHDFDDAGASEDAEIEQHLSNALDLFRFVHGKAVFEAFYKKDLARRLLMGRSASNDAERAMLNRLRNECGSGFTHNLEVMFKDMDLAREEIMSYNQLMEDRGTTSNLDLSVNVLSSAAWPTYPDIPVNIPTSIAKATANFEMHYKSKHQGRKLAWKHALAHCQLRARFSKGNKEIVVSGFQAIVLLLFNDIAIDAHLTYNDIRNASGLPDVELRRTLQSLACAKYRVLTKQPKGREVNETDTFTFNNSFQDPKMRIKINQIQLKETKEENKETHERVAADRHYETQAAIVRIMKSRKTIGHNDLIIEVIKATRSRGVLDQTDIKRNIEKLIEKEYMEREGGNKYAYVA